MTFHLIDMRALRLVVPHRTSALMSQSVRWKTYHNDSVGDPNLLGPQTVKPDQTPANRTAKRVDPPPKSGPRKVGSTESGKEDPTYVACIGLLCVGVCIIFIQLMRSSGSKGSRLELIVPAYTDLNSTPGHQQQDQVVPSALASRFNKPLISLFINW